VNSFGDEQLAVDMLADKLLFEALRFSVSHTHTGAQLGSWFLRGHSWLTCNCLTTHCWLV
jgi:hypothetical protein